jgi:hypothetical protein
MNHKGKIAAAIVAVVVVAVAAVPLFVNVNTFKPLIEEQLTTALGRQTKLGDLSLSVLSGTVVARDLQIADDPQFSKQPFVTAKEFISSLSTALRLIPRRSIWSMRRATPGIFQPSAKALPTGRRSRSNNQSSLT